MKLHEDDRKKLFSHIAHEAGRALNGEFDPIRGGLKKVVNEKGEIQLVFVPSVLEDL